MTEQTFGQRAVGASFNPSGDDKVAQLKAAAATFIDLCDALRNDTINNEVKRMAALMHDALGIGLAAPQVGISHRLLVINNQSV